MLGVSLIPFLTLTLIAAAVAVTYHNVIRYLFLEDNDNVLGRLIAGWLGRKAARVTCPPCPRSSPPEAGVRPQAA